MPRNQPRDIWLRERRLRGLFVLDLSRSMYSPTTRLAPLLVMLFVQEHHAGLFLPDPVFAKQHVSLFSAVGPTQMFAKKLLGFPVAVS